MISASPPKMPVGDLTVYPWVNLSCQLCAHATASTTSPRGCGRPYHPSSTPSAPKLGEISSTFHCADQKQSLKHLPKMPLLVKKVLLASFATCNFTPLCYIFCFVFPLIFWALPWIWKRIRNMLLGSTSLFPIGWSPEVLLGKQTTNRSNVFLTLSLKKYPTQL